MEKNSRIYIAGHRGLVGSAIVRRLENDGYKNLIFKEHSELDLTRQKETEDFFAREKPDYVFLAAAKVGGIKANIENPASFIYDNIQIQNNVIHASWKYKVKKLLFIGSNCMYPKDKQPMKEEYLLTGKLEPTNESYAVAKIAGGKLCQAYNKQHGTNFISVVPASMFGENDNFDEDGHLIPALIRRFHEAKINKKKEAVLWGTGNPKRELMYVDNAADAFMFLMESYNSSEIINIGVGEDFSVKEIADIVKDIVGFNGKIVFDRTKPDGIFRKLLDSGKINSLGWKPKIGLKEGLMRTYRWYKENIA